MRFDTLEKGAPASGKALCRPGTTVGAFTLNVDSLNPMKMTRSRSDKDQVEALKFHRPGAMMGGRSIAVIRTYQNGLAQREI